MRKIFAILLSVLMVASLLSFSISAEEPAYVAKIVKADNTEKSYTVIGSAAEALQDGDTLKILANISEVLTIVPPANGTVTVEGNKNVKLLNELYIDSPASGKAVVNVKNVVLEQSNDVAAFYVKANNTVNAENCYIKNNKTKQTICVSKDYSTNVVLNMKNCTIENTKGYNTYVRFDTEANFENCLFISSKDYPTIQADVKSGVTVVGKTMLDHCYVDCLKGAFKATATGWNLYLKNSTVEYNGSGDGVVYFNKAFTATVDNVHFINSAGTACLSGQSSDSSSVLGVRFENPTHVKDMNGSNKKIAGLPGDPATVVPSTAAYLDFNGFDASKVAKRNAVGYVPEADPVVPGPVPSGSTDPTPATGDNFVALVAVLGAAVLTAGTVLVVRKKED